MRYTEFRTLLSRHEYISTEWIYRYIPDFDKRRLHERTKKGYMIALRRGWYLFADVGIDRDLLLHLASVIYRPSYISLFTALSRYGLIPETVVRIQSISPKKTAEFITDFAHRSYQSCKSSSYEGYVTHQTIHGMIVIASPEKMIIDLMYYYPQYRSITDIESLRLNWTRLKELGCDSVKLRMYAGNIGSDVTVKAVEVFISYYQGQG